MVIKEQLERVRVLRLANPPANVLNRRLLDTLRGEIEDAAADHSVRALVLASSYPRYFSAGLDLTELTSQAKDKQAEHFHALLDVYRSLRAVAKPTVAAIGGSALLGGWILAMACDFRILSEDGRISLAEIRFGMSPTAALLLRLREISSSPTLVKEMALKGRTLRSEEALAGGFVDRVVPNEQVQEEAMKEARGLAKGSLSAYAAVKRALWRRAPGDDEAVWRESREDFESLFATAEAQEGIAAMRDKRRPRFAGGVE
jgi:enoyl-CoA hydratase/carnithine racemase